MKYEKIKYPDGQISAKWIGNDDSFIIKERINSYEDLIFICAIADIAKYHQVKYELVIPCLFGQRSDRRFDVNQSFDLKIITDIINKCQFSKVHIFDPHSDVSLALIDNSYKISSLSYVNKAVMSLERFKNLVLVSPDAGAYKKVFDYGTQLKLPVVAANKFRDLQGNINLSFMGSYKEVIDDLFNYVFDLKVDVVCQGNNIWCTQGAGIAPFFVKHFGTDKFPMEAEEFRGDINKLGTIDYQELPIKDGKVVEWDYINRQDTIFVVNMYTQADFGLNHKGGKAVPADYDAIRLCMRKLNSIFKGLKIGLPAIGAGLAGGDWNIISNIIQEEMKNCDVTVVLLPNFDKDANVKLPEVINNIITQD